MVASPVGQFGLQNAGSAGAEKHTNALCAKFFDGSMHRLGKAILHQAQQRKPIVAAIEFGQVCWNPHFIHSCHLAYNGRQIHRVKCARGKSCTTLAQCGKRLVETATDAAGRGEMGKPERVQGI